MKTWAVVAALLSATACGGSRGGPWSAASDSAVVFGGEALAQGSEVFRGTFTPDGLTFYYFRKVTPNSEDYRIFRTRWSSGVWTAPDRVTLGGEFSDMYPALSPSGDRLVFASYRRAPGDTTARPNASLWLARDSAGQWSAPVALQSLSRPGFYHLWVEFDSAGSLIFRRTTPDWAGTETLLARAAGDGFAAPEPFAPFEEVRQQFPDLQLEGGSPGPRGSLFLDVPTADSAGRRGSDILVAERELNGWSRPRPLAAGVTTAGFDVFPTVTPDGNALVFVRGFRVFYQVSLDAALGR